MHFYTPTPVVPTSGVWKMLKRYLLNGTEKICSLTSNLQKRNFKLFVLLLFGGFCLSQQNYTIHFPTLAPHTLFLWRADGENKQTSTLPTLSHSTPSPREPLPAPQIKAPAHSTALAGPEPAPGLLHTSRPQSQTDGH